MPGPLEARPELLPGLEVYVEAFALLGGAFPGGAAPLSEIKTCCEMLGMDETEERRRMVLYLRAMAAVHGEVMTEQAKAGDSGGTSQQPMRISGTVSHVNQASRNGRRRGD